MSDRVLSGQEDRGTASGKDDDRGKRSSSREACLWTDRVRDRQPHFGLRL